MTTKTKDETMQSFMRFLFRKQQRKKTSLEKKDDETIYKKTTIYFHLLSK